MSIRTLLIGAAVGAAAIAASASGASASVVCNNAGDCWHTTDRYAYPSGFGITVHDDNWKWHDRDHYRWHEHTGRGYWRNGLWVTF